MKAQWTVVSRRRGRRPWTNKSQGPFSLFSLLQTHRKKKWKGFNWINFNPIIIGWNPTLPVAAAQMSYFFSQDVWRCRCYVPIENKKRKIKEKRHCIVARADRGCRVSRSQRASSLVSSTNTHTHAIWRPITSRSTAPRLLAVCVLLRSPSLLLLFLMPINSSRLALGSLALYISVV